MGIPCLESGERGRFLGKILVAVGGKSTGSHWKGEKLT